MRTVKLDNWEAFETEIRTLFEKYPLASTSAVNPMLFRGQSDASWKLEATLERYPVQLLKTTEYYKVISAARPQIETYMDQLWDIPSAYEYAQTLGNQEFGFGVRDFPAYEYMVYLRHHGFPSPLLDWTTSPYVAAFFAFRHTRSEGKYVSIYAYLEHAGYGKLSEFQSPHIIRRGSYIRSHRRHLLQQCAYTVCAVKKDEEWYYACHEDVFEKGTDEQDLLWKFNLPASEREKVFRALDRYNLNAYSLFGSEESLMETVAQREILFRQK